MFAITARRRIEKSRRESMRRPVGKLPGIHATTPLTYKYAHDRGQVFTLLRSFSMVPAKTSLSILGVNFSRLSVESSYVFCLPWFYETTNYQYETPYILFSRPASLPPFVRIDRIWWIHVLEVQIYLLIFDYMTSNFICLGVTTLRSSSSWRMD